MFTNNQDQAALAEPNSAHELAATSSFSFSNASFLSLLLYVLDSSDGRTLDFVPVDALVELFVDEADEADVVAPDEVQAELDLLGVVRVVGVVDHALDRLSEDLGERGGERREGRRHD